MSEDEEEEMRVVLEEEDEMGVVQVPITTPGRRTVKKGEGHTCTVCKKWFKTKCNLNKHLPIHQPGGSKDCRCYVCGIEMSTTWFPRHFTKHENGENIYNLDRGREEFICHHQQQSGNPSKSCGPPKKKYACHLCEKSFDKRRGLTTHMDIHRTLKCLKCHVCGYDNNNHSTMSLHYLRHHPGIPYDVNVCKDEAKKPSGNYINVAFSCDIPGCKFVFPTLKILEYHKRRGHRIFKCPYQSCSKVFSENRNLRNHISSHTGQFQYLCEYCGHQFGFLSSLSHHIKSLHLKIRYSCVTCKKSLTAVGSLRKHQKLHSPIKCGGCDLEFSTKLLYLSHISLHRKDACGQTAELDLIIKMRDLCQDFVRADRKRRREESELEDEQLPVKKKKYTHVMWWPCGMDLGENMSIVENKCNKGAFCYTSRNTPQERILDLMKLFLKDLRKGCISILAHIRQDILHEMNVLGAKFIVRCRYFVIAMAVKRLFTGFIRHNLITNVTKFYPLFYFSDEVFHLVAKKIVKLSLQPIIRGIPMNQTQLFKKIKTEMAVKVASYESLPRGIPKIVVKDGMCTFEKRVDLSKLHWRAA